MKMQIITPPNAETAITGFLGAAEKIIGNSLWRIEYWQGDKFPTVYRDGKAQASLCICPKAAIKFGNSATQYFNKVWTMQGAH
jgi:hypothetical protein